MFVGVSTYPIWLANFMTSTNANAKSKHIDRYSKRWFISPKNRAVYSLPKMAASTVCLICTFRALLTA